MKIEFVQQDPSLHSSSLDVTKYVQDGLPVFDLTKDDGWIEFLSWTLNETEENVREKALSITEAFRRWAGPTVPIECRNHVILVPKEYADERHGVIFPIAFKKKTHDI